MNLKDFLLGGAVVIALIALVFVFNVQTQTTTVSQNEPTYGASPGPERFNKCESRDGITQCFTRTTLRTATTTPCSIQAPTAGTSTLSQSGVVRFTYASSTGAQTIHVARSRFQNATTTLLMPAITTVANEPITIMASSTTFGPGEWLNIGMQGTANAANNAPIGVCQATFEVI